MKTRHTMKQWRLILLSVSSVLAVLFILQISSKLMLSKSSGAGENVNLSRPNPVRILSSRQVSKSETSTPSPTTKKFSRKLQHAFRRSNSSKHFVVHKDSKLRNHKHFCWENEEFHIVGGCIRCSSYEKRVSKSCQETGNKQLVLCITSNKKSYKSCPRVQWIEERNFWSFEGTMLILLIISSISVWQRNKKLDSVYKEKLRKKVCDDNS